MTVMEISCKECGNMYKVLSNDNEVVDIRCPVCDSDDVKQNGCVIMEFKCKNCNKKFGYPYNHTFTSGFISEDRCPFCGCVDFEEC